MFLNERAQANRKGKYFEVRYFLNVIVGSSHTFVLLILFNREANGNQKTRNSAAAHRAHTHG